MPLLLLLLLLLVVRLLLPPLLVDRILQSLRDLVVLLEVYLEVVASEVVVLLEIVHTYPLPSLQRVVLAVVVELV